MDYTTEFTVRNVFTVKHGFLFGFGMTLGGALARSIIKGANKATKEILGDYKNDSQE